MSSEVDSLHRLRAACSEVTLKCLSSLCQQDQTACKSYCLVDPSIADEIPKLGLTGECESGRFSRPRMMAKRPLLDPYFTLRKMHLQKIEI